MQILDHALWLTLSGFQFSGNSEPTPGIDQVREEVSKCLKISKEQISLSTLEEGIHMLMYNPDV